LSKQEEELSLKAFLVLADCTAACSTIMIGY